MPLPIAVTTVTVHGRYVRPDGTPLHGSVTFAVPALLSLSGADTVATGSATFTLDAQGEFTAILVATDNPSMQPTGWAYVVTEKFTDVTGRSYALALPSTSPVVDIADVAPAAPSQLNYVPVVGPEGPAGTDGADGNTILSGHGAPLVGVGIDGDFWLDLDATALYGPKTSGTWPGSGVALVGGDLITSVNGLTGNVDLTAADVEADPAGSASAAQTAAAADATAKVAAHASAVDPHGDRAFTTSITGPLTSRVTTLESNLVSAIAQSVSLGSVSGAVTLDLSAGRTFTCTVTGPVVFSFTNWPAGATATEPTVIAIQDGVGHSIAFTGITWLPTGSPPSFQTGASQVNITSFFSADNGTTVYGQGGAATGGGFGVYGDGSDGAVVLDGTNTYSTLGKSGNTYWLLRDCYFSSVTIASGVTLQFGGGGTAPFRAFCTGTVSVASGAFVTTSVNTPASGATGGSNSAFGSLVPGANGPSGTTGGGVTGNNVAGAGGGFGGKGGNAAAGSVVAGTNGISSMPTGASLPRALPWASNLSYLVNGVPGYFPGGCSGSPGAGDGTNAGGGAGPGGNPLFLAAQNVLNNGTIKATGGTGAAGTGGNAGGGGGGQGGPIMLIYGAYSGSGSISSIGGNGGAGVGTGSAGAPGGAAWIVRLVN